MLVCAFHFCLFQGHTMELSKIIQEALYEFIRPHIPDADISTLDDVVLSYITGVLEDLGTQDCVEENFDVEMFVEMLEAYVPGFAGIDSVKVCEMMFNLAVALTKVRNKEHVTPKTPAEVSSANKCDSSTDWSFINEKHYSSAWPEGATAKEASNEDKQVQLLLEMFPTCTITDARSALSVSKWDIQEAVQLIIEGDMKLNQSLPPKVSGGNKTETACIEKSMKNKKQLMLDMFFKRKGT
ncbi:CUE domain-containing protein 2 isoform X3 [Polyodon spathula]|uniref:CUE domain-containing protein 2 isoform X3 n=1 Tax=Polyodon spathula TaxID=7913 RepID=UPI001B7E5263|nr:CUE domain-containing protein 2 isoform X3 [Polyodon spathula]